MDVDEDVALCKAFISIIQDPINGSRQKSSTMWARIYEAFTRRFPNGHSHTVITLQRRWKQIDTNVNIFMGCLAQAERLRLRGWTLTDIEVMEHARKDYQFSENKSFEFESCYEVLKDIPKFSLSMTRLNNLHHYPDYVFSNVGSSSIRRPSGRKAAEKERAKKKKRTMDPQLVQRESERNRRLDLMNEIFAESIKLREKEQELKEKELELKEEKLERRKRQVEDHIMYMDTSRMTDEQKLHLEFRREQIMAHKRNGGPST